MSRLILADQSEIQVGSSSSLSDARVVSQTKQDMITAWDRLTDENLKTVRIQNEGGVVIGEYRNLMLEKETSTILQDGTILTSFRLREKTEVELLREKVEQLESGQEVQDGAIVDLAAVVDSLSESGKEE